MLNEENYPKGIYLAYVKCQSINKCYIRIPALDHNFIVSSDTCYSCLEELDDSYDKADKPIPPTPDPFINEYLMGDVPGLSVSFENESVKEAIRNM